MTTQSWSTRCRSDSDATFREWGSEFAAKMAACGMVQTSDTGQINWTTVTRPGTNTEAGFEIWRFNDSLQGTAPIYIRVGYGTGSQVSAPRLQATVGTGTNGSGTLTGTALTSTRGMNSANSSVTTDTARQSYMVHTEGLFAVNWKVGSPGTDCATFIVSRTCDSSGSPSATGALVVWGNSGNSTAHNGTQALRFAATAAAYSAITAYVDDCLCAWPTNPTSSQVGSDIQAMLCFTITPRVEPLNAICAVRATDVTPGSTFTATLVGTTAHTYIAFTTDRTATPAGATSPLVFAVIWE